MTKGELAKKNFESGMNCAQAVLLAFKDEMNMDEVALKKLIIGFGGGFGRQGLVCGAISGMTMVIGAANPDKDKLACYQLVVSACEEVKAKLGALDCKTLKAENKVPCGEICKIVAEITEKYILNFI